MKKTIFALLICLFCGCEQNGSVDAGTDVGSDVPVNAQTSVDASVDQ